MGRITSDLCRSIVITELLDLFLYWTETFQTLLSTPDSTSKPFPNFH